MEEIFEDINVGTLTAKDVLISYGDKDSGIRAEEYPCKGTPIGAVQSFYYIESSSFTSITVSRIMFGGESLRQILGTPHDEGVTIHAKYGDVYEITFENCRIQSISSSVDVKRDYVLETMTLECC